MIQANTLLQNRYRIISQIGKGGMGTVYVAKDENLGITVAVKHNLFTEQRLIEAFKREARLLASLRHPALPQVKDHFLLEDAGQFLVMEFIAGDDLETILEKRLTRIAPEGEAKPFGVEQTMHWAEQLLDALDYLHTRSEPILHRDIKPQNLKLAERNQIILLDFGLAKGKPLQMTQVTTTGSLYGYTPNYAPIEQIRGIGTDPRSDLYALGATLYHLITGVPPVDATTRADTFLGGEIDPLRPVNELNPEVPQAVATVLMKAMEQHRSNRPASAVEMLKMLRAAKNPTIPDLQSQAVDVERERRSEQATTTSQPEALERKTREDFEKRTQQVAQTQSEPVRISAQQEVISKPINASIAPAVQHRSVKKKWLVIGGAGLLIIVLAVITFVLIANKIGAIKALDDKTKNAAPLVSKSGVFQTSGKVFKVSISDDAQTLVAACDETTIRLWQPNLAKELFGQIDRGRSVQISRDGQTVIAGSQDGTVRLWQVNDGEVLKTLGAHSDYVFDVGFSPDGKTFYSASGDKTVKLWRTNDAEPVVTVNTPEEGFQIIAVSPDLKLVGFYNLDGRFKLWSTADDSFLRYLQGDVPFVNCAAFSNDGQLVALGSRDGEVQVWRTGDGRMLKSLGKVEFAVISIVFSANGQILAAGFSNGMIKVWRIGDGALIKAFEDHTGAVNSLSFSADGRTLASGSDDNSVRVRNVAEK